MTANSTEPDTGQRIKALEEAVYNLQRERSIPGPTIDNCPTGMIAGFLSDTPPAGWILLAGQSITAAAYPALHAYLTANGFSTTLPDYADKFLVGAGVAYTSTSTGGSANAVVVSHSHPGFDHNHATGLHSTASESAGFGLTASASFADRVRVNGAGDTTGTDGAAYTTGTTGVAAAGANLPPYQGVYWMIRT